jgi:3'(2'),5'-bisphosphate nucleotidase
MMSTLSDELDFASRLARSAGAMALDFQRRGVVPETKAGDEPVTEADRAVNAHILAALAERYPDDAVLAEESPPDPRRFDVVRTWMVDPIDGTREFIAGTDSWEVLIGLVVDGEPVLGAVYNPTTNTAFAARRGGGAWVTRDGAEHRLEIARGKAGRKLRMAVRRGHYRGVPEEVAAELGIEDVRHKRSFGARALLVAESEVDLVLHVGGSPKEWDTCALHAIVEEAGGVMLNCLGERPRYLKSDDDLVQPHGMVITARDLAEPVMRVITPIYEMRLGSGA